MTARTALDCAHFLYGKPQPNACRVTGLIATSEVCRYDEQCGTGYCRFAAGASCGNCVTRGETGAPCTTSSDCDGDLMCAGSGTCQPPASATSPCSATMPCDTYHAGNGQVEQESIIIAHVKSTVKMFPRRWTYVHCQAKSKKLT